MIARALASLLALALALTASTACAAGLGVSPVTLEFTPQHKVLVLEVSNPSDTPTSVQLRLFAWSGGGTQERYDATSDVRFSPPMFTLAPGDTQIVRLAVDAPMDRERSYRLLVDELAPPHADGLVMPVRMALPVFVDPMRQPPPKVSWRLAHDGEGPLLIARNDGGRRLKVMNLQLVRGQSTQMVGKGLAGYVLAGQERAWRLTSAPGAGRVTVRALTDQGDLISEIGPD